jgi:hypothetical protein
MNWTTLVDAGDLAASLGDDTLRLIDARFMLMNRA